MFTTSLVSNQSGLRRAIAVSTVVCLWIFVAVAFAQMGRSRNAGVQQDSTNSRVESAASPIFGVELPAGHRKWDLIGVSQSEKTLTSIVGNHVAINAYQEGKEVFPDDSILVKLSWKREPLEEFEGTFESGAATMIQVMAKDSKKYASTGGWGFGRFIDGKPTTAAEHEECFSCHSSTEKVRKHDFVFTRLAP